MSEREDRLNFKGRDMDDLNVLFEAYFYQWWFLDTPDWRDLIREFGRDTSSVKRLIDSIEFIFSEIDNEADLEVLFKRLGGVDLDVGEFNMNYREWLTNVVALLRDEISKAGDLEN